MNTIWILLLGSFLAAAPPSPDNRPAQKKSPNRTVATDTKNSVEEQYEKLLSDDDIAQQEVDQWIRDARAIQAKGGAAPVTLNARIDQRFAVVRKAYEDFLRRHPEHTRARIAFGSFLDGIREEGEAVKQWDKAIQLDSKNPAAWNNLANHYGHRGPVDKAFKYYEKAIELDPEEPVYLHNLAITTYLFRKDAMEIYKLNETQVFDRSLDLYRKAIKLDPDNFPLASDFAQCYYGIKPLRAEEALAAWNYALKVANDDIERQGVYIHMARVELNSGLFSEARKHLEGVTHEMYAPLKERLVKNLSAKEANAKSLAAPPVNATQPK